MRPYTCEACADEKDDKCIRIDGSKVCPECFRYLFELAVEDESNYPAHWGNKQLDYTLYEHTLGRDLVRRYKAKQIEYACPPFDRIYCSRTDPPKRPEKCQGFVGGFNMDKGCIRCEKCKWYTCLRCEETFSTSTKCGKQIAIEHECDPRMEADIRQRALEDLKQGKDYQFCPNPKCKRAWALWDGCNHMRCTCGSYFCFVCGAKVKSGYNHWSKGKSNCPLYGDSMDPRQDWLRDQHDQEEDIIAFLAERERMEQRFEQAEQHRMQLLQDLRRGRRLGQEHAGRQDMMPGLAGNAFVAIPDLMPVHVQRGGMPRRRRHVRDPCCMM